ncbi:hypothetical protein N9373_06005 [Flavobacteriaceae bacterium]|nr:hypothetical protein [Flavobacteriaceae bacterium]
MSKIFFFILIFAELYLGGLKIYGIISVRVPLILLSCVLIFSLPKPKIHSFNILKLSFSFAFCYLLSVIFDNYADINIFLNEFFISRFAFTFIICTVSIVLIPKYISIRQAIDILILILSFNVIILICQYHNFDNIWQITNFFTSNKIDDSYSIHQLEKYNNIRGITGTVYSGYLIVTLFPLILLKLRYGKTKIIWWGSLIVVLYTSYILGQRGAFYLVLLNLFYFFFYSSDQRSMSRIFKILVVIIIILFFGYDILESISDTRFVNNDISSRLIIAISSLNFIIDNPIFGGLSSYYRYADITSHNLFLNAWIWGGFLGFIVIVLVVFKIFKKGFKTLFSISSKNNFNYILYLVLINLIFLSFSHNSGIVTGDILTNLFITLIIIYESNDKMLNV